MLFQSCIILYCHDNRKPSLNNKYSLIQKCLLNDFYLSLCMYSFFLRQRWIRQIQTHVFTLSWLDLADHVCLVLEVTLALLIWDQEWLIKKTRFRLRKRNQCWEFKPAWALMDDKIESEEFCLQPHLFLFPRCSRRPSALDRSRVPPGAFMGRETKCLECAWFDLHDSLYSL